MTTDIVGNKDPDKLRVFIVRHGRTDWNVKKILQGHIDIDINEDGADQAQKLGELFKNIKLDNVISSDLCRCVNTCKPVLKHQNNPTYSETPKLRERDMGIIQGMSLSAALQEYGEDFKNFGEKKPELIARVSEIYNHAIKVAKLDNHKNIFLCTHGGVIRAFLTHLHEELDYGLGGSLCGEDLLVPFNTSVTVIDIDKATGAGVIEQFGVTKHLGCENHPVNQLLR